MMTVDSRVVVRVTDVSKQFTFSSNRDNTIKSIFMSLRHKRDKSSTIQHALNNISFEIKEGEFFGIVGRNGSGKSTLLKMLAGIYQPTSGEISVGGKLVPFIELGVGFNPELTGRENVYLNGAMLGFSESEVDEFYEEVVEFAELEKFMDKKLKNYSSGMQVRLAFSMAIRAEAEVLLVDEVLAVGDADFQRKCFEYFKTLKRNKKTVVFVSHDMSAVREYCDKAILIDRGKIVSSGKSDLVATEYLKMFNGTNSASVNKNIADRWGSNQVMFKDVSATADKDLITIKTTVSGDSTVVNPIFGFLIKDNTDNELFGTNTLQQRVKIPQIRPGQETTIEWSVPNILNDGDFFITLAISDRDGVTQLDWWNNAIKLHIDKSEKRTPYAINPNVAIRVKTV